MDNLTLVRRYITKHYEVYVADNVKIRDLHTSGIIKLPTLIEETEQIFDCNCSDIINDWYKKCFRDQTRDIHEYLDQYRVNLGTINWEVLDKDNNLFEIRDMVKHFEGKYDEKFIRNLQNDWYIEKIYKNTEERLKFKVLD